MTLTVGALRKGRPQEGDEMNSWKIKVLRPTVVEDIRGLAEAKEIGATVEVSASVGKYLVAVGKAEVVSDEQADMLDQATDRQIDISKPPVRSRAKQGRG